jgi:uncharacterized membrane protein
MLIESTAHLPVGFAFAGDLFHSPTATDIARILLRWSHFVFGITWIGLLYFFNLVNVPFQKEIDADTKKKVNPSLLSRSLWYFRWGAVGTVLVGLAYYAMYILSADVTNANAGGGAVNVWVVLLVWLLMPIIVFAIEYAIIMKVPALTKDGRLFAVVVLVLVIIMAYIIIWWLDGQLTVGRDHFASNKTFSIGIGGALGLIMLLNVWGIIWPLQKRIIAAAAGTGPATPPEFARRSFIASRTNTWLSLPLLFLMATSHGDWIIFGH